MRSPKIPLVIIPGLGDRIATYRLLIPIWRILGYDAHIFSFEWEDTTENFQSVFDRLLRHIDEYEGEAIYIIGVSAGGTAAVNALSTRPLIVRKVVTVATPYTYVPHLRNAKLMSSIEHLQQIRLDRLGKNNLLSIHGIYDQIVPIASSQPTGVRTYRVVAIVHSIIIAVSLTMYSVYIRRFLTSN